MFNRNIINELGVWKRKEGRKPLILRGARQTGKTVAVNIFAKKFQNFVDLNLDRESDKQLFEKSDSIEQLIRSIEVVKGRTLSQPDTLLFIDEVQNSEKAIKFLRFFYEDHPKLFVIAAGSLLEAIMKKEGFSFPVGRVEFLYLYPVTFDEFLLATGNEKLFEALGNVTVKKNELSVLHDRASELFMQYSLVGGMPAVVQNYNDKRSLASASAVKEDLITAIKDDVAKYSKHSETKYVRHIIEYAPYHVGERIKYEKFGQSEFHSREMKNAFETLEYAMVVQRVFGSYSTALPIEPNFQVSPKIIYLDCGLVVNKLGITEDMLFAKDLNALFKGKLAEQIAGQAFLSMESHKITAPCFWYRNSPGSIAETDYVIQHKGKIVPVEVKSGKSGSLKSLNRFMMASDSNIALRLYSGVLAAEKVENEGKTFTLLSVPFYLQWNIKNILDELKEF